MPRSVVGTFLVGQRLVGQNSLDFAKPKLRLGGRPFSLTVLEDAQVALFPTRARMRLVPGTFTISAEQNFQFPTARLHLVGGAFRVVVPVGPTYPQRAVLRLRGGSFPLGIGQTLAFEKPKLRLVARAPSRVGQPGLIPTAPVLVTLVPSPVEVGLLVPTTEEGVLLTPTAIKVV